MNHYIFQYCLNFYNFIWNELLKFRGKWQKSRRWKKSLNAARENKWTNITIFDIREISWHVYGIKMNKIYGAKFLLESKTKTCYILWNQLPVFAFSTCEVPESANSSYQYQTYPNRVTSIFICKKNVLVA